jgi:hypothetical protein
MKLLKIKTIGFKRLCYRQVVHNLKLIFVTKINIIKMIKSNYRHR